MSYYYGNTSTSSWGNEKVWIYAKGDSFYTVEKKKKEKEFISEEEFKM